ncbi:MAG: DUF998 domain-containing protein [Actinocatenispora sp.]
MASGARWWRRRASGSLTRRVVSGAAVGSLALTAAAVVSIGYLHVVEHISPVRTMVSDYVFTDLGAVLLPAGMLTFAGAIALASTVLVAERLAGRRIAALLGAGSVGLVLMACFPGDATGASSTATGLVHKAGGALLFGAMPVAGWLLAQRLRGGARVRRLAAALRQLALFDAAAFAIFLATYLPGLGVTLPGGTVLAGIQGLAERVALIPQVALVALVAAWLATRPNEQLAGTGRNPAVGRRPEEVPT